MTRNETLAILSVLKAAYPHFYKDTSKEDLKTVVSLWHNMFEDESADIVTYAVKAFISNDAKGFPPVIGAIKEQIYKLKNPDEMTEAEAWEFIKKAVSRSAYTAKEEFDKLPQELQQLVGSPKTLKEYGLMDTETLNSVVASNFMRSYRVKTSNIKEYNKLPDSVKGMSESLVNRLPDVNTSGVYDFEEGKRKLEAQLKSIGEAL